MPIRREPPLERVPVRIVRVHPPNLSPSLSCQLNPISDFHGTEVIGKSFGGFHGLRLFHVASCYIQNDL